MVDDEPEVDYRSWEEKGYDSFPERHNYPEAATPEETQWLRGWYRRMREVQFEQQAPDLDADSLAGRDTFAAQYKSES